MMVAIGDHGNKILASSHSTGNNGTFKEFVGVMLFPQRDHKGPQTTLFEAFFIDKSRERSWHL